MFFLVLNRLKARLKKRNAKIAVLLILIVCPVIIYFLSHAEESQPEPKESNPDYQIEINSNDPVEYRSAYFFGKYFCYPGYYGEDCNIKYEPANPWYITDCPNLKKSITYDPEMKADMLSKEKYCSYTSSTSHDLNKCMILCFSHPHIGISQIPKYLWKIFLNNQIKHWIGKNHESDRGEEHLEGFANYKAVPPKLGNFIEIGCGPYTQTQFIIKRTFTSITLLDPGAENYMLTLPTCIYKNKKLFDKTVTVLNIDAESLPGNYSEKYDTVMSINVIEHVWNGFLFLTNLHRILKPGGILIFHERYYSTPLEGEGYLDDSLHPIRMKKEIFDEFFKQFKPLYMFEGQTSAQISREYNERGFYFVGRKL